MNNIILVCKQASEQADKQKFHLQRLTITGELYKLKAFFN